MVCYFVDGFINNRNYLQIGCKNNKSLLRPIDLLTIESMREILKISFSNN